MKRFAWTLLLALLCAPNARAAGEIFTLRWVEERYCPDIDPIREVRGGYLHISSDTELDLCSSLFICALETNTIVTGTTTLISPRRAVFVGKADSNLVYAGPTVIEADLVLGRDGEVKSVRGTFISPAVEGMCASRGRFLTTKRTD